MARRACPLCARDQSDVDYVYIWVDGVYVNLRLPGTDGNADRLCLLVIVGVRPDGTKELVAVTDGHREDTNRGCTSSGICVTVG